MNIADFALERYFARWEFSARHLLCASDIESYGLTDLLALADSETRALWDGLRLGYTESTGHPLLRREIASLYSGVTPEDVLVFAGAEEAIFLTMHALLGPGDHAVVAWPAYQSLFEVARSAGAEVTLLPLDPADWSLDVDRVRAELRPNTKVVVVNFPHSPTGALMNRDAYQRLVALAEERGIVLFSDEVYRWLEIDESQRLPAAVGLGARAVSLGVMSKSFALAGLRVGWLATRNTALLRRVAALKDYTTICSSAPSEVLALIALRARDAVLARSRGILARNLPLLDAFFERMAEHFSWVRPRAGSVAFPRMERGDSAALERFAAALVEAEGVLLLPGSQFGYPGSHFRLGFGRLDLPVALERLEAFACKTLG
jgi:aspartate/methionine/tyrosine aminotransferase